MTGYIVLMTLGSLAMAGALITWLIFSIKRRQARYLLRKIGNASETEVNADVRKWAKSVSAAFLPAALYKYGTNRLFEVDSMLITTKAVIVIEIKSISGVISGEPSAPVWTKTLGEKKFPITNPIQQNDTHIAHLQSMVKFDYPIISLIVYSNRAEALAIKNLPAHVIVAKHSELASVLTELDNRLVTKIDPRQMKNLARQIKRHATRKRADMQAFFAITEQKK